MFRAEPSSVAARLALAAVLAWVMIHPAAATDGAATHSPPADDLKGLSIEELMAVEVPSVVGASKREQKVTEAPSAVSVVTADDIRKFGYRTLADALRSVRGFYVSTDRLYGFIGARGFNRPGDFGGRILLLVDGHRLNEPIFDSAFNMMDFVLDVDLIDRVEVVRGPGSTLYGNNAFFAIVNVITKRGKHVAGTEVAAATASYRDYRGRLTYGNTFRNGLDLLVSGTYFDAKGRQRIYERSYDDGSRHGGIARDLDGENGFSLFASARYGGFSMQSAFVRREKYTPLAIYDTQFDDPRNRSVDSRGFLSLTYAATLAQHWDASVRAYYDYYRLQAYYPYDAADDGESPFIALNRERDTAHWAGIEAQVSRVFLERLRVTAGAEGRHDFSLRVKSWDVRPFSVPTNLRSDASRVGVFLEEELRLFDRLRLNAGIRYDYYSTSGSTVNPRAALLFDVTDTAVVKLLYGQAYRIPNTWESEFENFFQRANPQLKAETIRTAELAFEQYLTATTHVGAFVFLNRIEDLIDQRQVDPDGTISYVNSGNAETHGAEVEVEHRTRTGLLARASYTLQRTEDRTRGTSISNSPRHLVKGNFVVPIWRDTLFSGLEVQYASEAKTIPGRSVGKADGFALLNFTLFSRELIEGLELSTTIFNLLDEEYGTPAGDEYRPAIIRQDGRTYRVRVAYRF